MTDLPAATAGVRCIAMMFNRLWRRRPYRSRFSPVSSVPERRRCSIVVLTGDHGLRVAVLVNDFGSLNIDADLVVGVDERDVVSLANGCVCCTIRDDLVEAVASVLDRPEAPQHVVLEASGVADPAGIAMTFLDSVHRVRLRIDSIICVIDASQVFAAPEQEQLKLWQIACADMVVLNKTDLVDADDIARIRTWLDDHFHRYRLIEADLWQRSARPAARHRTVRPCRVGAAPRRHGRA